MLGEDRVHLCSDAGPHPDQGGPHAHQAPCLSNLERGRPSLGQHPGTEQVGQRLGVDGVVLHPSVGDRLGRQRVSHVHLDAGISKEAGEPSPPEGRLKGDRRRRGLRHHFAEHPQNVGSARRHLSIHQQLAPATNCGHLRRLAVEVDSDVNHDQGLLPGGCLRAGTTSVGP